MEHGKSKYFSGKTYAEAQRKLNQAQLEQRQGVLASGPKQTVKDFLNYWLEEVHKATLKVSTYALYRRHLDNHLTPHLGHIQLQKLKVDHVQAFLNNELKEGMKAGTRKTTLHHTRCGLERRYSMETACCQCLPGCEASKTDVA